MVRVQCSPRYFRVDMSWPLKCESRRYTVSGAPVAYTRPYQIFTQLWLVLLEEIWFVFAEARVRVSSNNRP